jgi:hypothetical protein
VTVPSARLLRLLELEDIRLRPRRVIARLLYPSVIPTALLNCLPCGAVRRRVILTTFRCERNLRSFLRFCRDVVLDISRCGRRLLPTPVLLLKLSA